MILALTIISVMTPNGTLMAYTTPVDIKELRDQAAVVSKAWREHCKSTMLLKTLTIEFSKSNLLVRALQRNLLLVLVGVPTPNRPDDFIKITPEGPGDPRYPPPVIPEPDETSSSETPEGKVVSVEDLDLDEGSTGKQKLAPSVKSSTKRGKDNKPMLLHLQRRRLDTLTEYIQDEFKAKGFVMPDDQGLA